MIVSKEKSNKKKEGYDLYYGTLLYLVEICKKNFSELQAVNRKAEIYWEVGRPEDMVRLNELSIKERNLRSILIIDIAKMFESKHGTISLINFKHFLEQEFREIAKKYSDELERILLSNKSTIDKIIINRHKVVAHIEFDKKDFVKKRLIYTEDLLEMPITRLLKEIEDLLAGLDNPHY